MCRSSRKNFQFKLQKLKREIDWVCVWTKSVPIMSIHKINLWANVTWLNVPLSYFENVCANSVCMYFKRCSIDKKRKKIKREWANRAFERDQPLARALLPMIGRGRNRRTTINGSIYFCSVFSVLDKWKKRLCLDIIFFTKNKNQFSRHINVKFDLMRMAHERCRASKVAKNQERSVTAPTSKKKENPVVFICVCVCVCGR